MQYPNSVSKTNVLLKQRSAVCLAASQVAVLQRLGFHIFQNSSVRSAVKALTKNNSYHENNT